MRYLLILFCIAVAILVAVIALTARAEAHKVGDVDYSLWLRPNGGSCCGGQDCAPVTPGFLRREADNTFSVFRYGVWTHFPQETMTSFASPDAQVHACMSVYTDYQHQHIPYCLVLPGGD